MAIQQDDTNWSCDVLDTSQVQLDEDENSKNESYDKVFTPDKTTRKPLSSDSYCKQTVNKSYIEVIFCLFFNKFANNFLIFRFIDNF